MQMKVSNFFVDFFKRIKQTNKRMNKNIFQKEADFNAFWAKKYTVHFFGHF